MSGLSSTATDLITNDLGRDQIFQATQRWVSGGQFPLFLAQHLDSTRWVSTGEFDSSSCGATFLHRETQERLDVYLTHRHQELLEIPGWLITDVLVTDSKNKKIISLAPEIFGLYHLDLRYPTNIIPDRLYNCFINRGCPFRQSWFYQLYKQDLLHLGNVSYWCFDLTDPAADPIDNFDKWFVHNQIFNHEHQALRTQIPFKNFSCDIEIAILQSQKTLVLETFFEPNAIVLTEKTWRALQMPRPFLIFGSARSIGCLRSWGFDVYDDCIDHTYDDIDDEISRQMMILEQLKISLDITPSRLEQWQMRAQHNQKLLHNYGYRWPIKRQNICDMLNKQSPLEFC